MSLKIRRSPLIFNERSLKTLKYPFIHLDTISSSSKYHRANKRMLFNRTKSNCILLKLGKL